MTVSVSSDTHVRSAPRLSEYAVPFGAQTLLVSAFIVALGAPVSYSQGVADESLVGIVYALGGLALPALSALLVWRVERGSIKSADARRLIRGSFLGAAPALLLALWLVALGQGIVLLGVSVMAFVLALLLRVTCALQDAGRMCRSSVIVTAITATVTPVIILGMTEVLPHGISVIAGWAIPVAVAATGAAGAAIALDGCAGIQA